MAFSYTNLMSLSTEFYALLSSLFHQIAHSPDVLPVLPPKRWPTDSQEQQLLEDFQVAVAAWQSNNQERQLQVEARRREQAILLTISQTLASALELKPGIILDQLREIIDYTHAVLFSLEGQTLSTLAIRGPQRLKEAVPLHIQLDEPESQAVLLSEQQPQRIADVWSDHSTAKFLRSLLNDHAGILLEGVQAWLWIPLAVKGRVIGGIWVAHAEPDRFTPHHADLALTVANQAAITLVNAQLHEQAQIVATLQERQRLAQNLHDAVNQSLFSASLIAEVLPRVWERNPDEGRRSLEDLRRLTRGAIAEMRGLLVELQPIVIIDSDLGDLLRQLSDAFTGRTDVPVALTIKGTGALPTEVQIALYRLCQEGLFNITKHARASQVTIALHFNADLVELTIHDDGRGFDPTKVPTGHYGLNIMQDRAKTIGALLSVTSQVGQGTEIKISWNKPQQREAA